MNLNNIQKELITGKQITNIKLRVTYYSRVSTNHDDQINSLQNQTEYFKKMINENPNWIYVKGYVDEGITGTSDVKRTNFMEMINDAKQNKFDLIITKEISRFSRNTLDSIKYTRKLLEYGVAVLFINDNINTALQDSELRLTIMASMAQDEIRRLSERVKFGMNMSINKGKILGNNMLYGYKKDPKTEHLIIIEKEAKIIQKIYNMYEIEKLSLSKIAKQLNNSSIKTRQNNNWTPTAIKRILSNPKYKGYYCGKKSEVIDYINKKVIYKPEKDWIIYRDYEKIPPIINEKIWNSVNKQLKRKSISFKKQKNYKVIYKEKYPLSNKIICKEHNVFFHRRKSKQTSWYCSNYLKNGIKSCKSPIVKESEIYNIFNDILKILLINKDEIINYLINLYQKNNNKKNNLFELEEYNKKINSLLKRREKILELYLENTISKEEFNKENEKNNNELNKYKEKITFIKEEKTNKSKLKQYISEILTEKKFVKKSIELLLEKIIISKINNNREKINMNIYLNMYGNNLKKNYIYKRNYNNSNTKKNNIEYKINVIFK